ncbi:Hypothetical protein NTJ_07523 [Nesidiocoris tenuis]|uniref:Uncharacterized protein n=1 Tax=Nesidiocoris tenuis TaxID=355587 RepID=A0ABN7ATA9_9HEMI|nr:Hypothetical protein NTJ_07523 [Nesidiocoris tenuis]
MHEPRCQGAAQMFSSTEKQWGEVFIGDSFESRRKFSSIVCSRSCWAKLHVTRPYLGLPLNPQTERRGMPGKSTAPIGNGSYPVTTLSTEGRDKKWGVKSRLAQSLGYKPVVRR